MDNSRDMLPDLMRFGLLITVFITVFVSLFAVAGCGALCNSDNACATTGMPGETQICDGSSFRSCDDGNRGQTVSCPKVSERAVCSPHGWTIEVTP